MSKRELILLITLIIAGAIYTTHPDLSSIFDDVGVSIAKKYKRCAGQIIKTVTIRTSLFDVSTEDFFSYATGFLVNKKNRIILTNWHVAKLTESVSDYILFGEFTSVVVDIKYKFVDFKGRQHNAKPLNISNRPHDLAIMSISISENDIEDLYEAEMDDSGTAEVAEDVIVVGYSMGYNLSVVRGIISSLEPKTPKVYGNKTLDCIQTDAGLNSGNSGSPMIRVKNGKVIGVVNSVLPDANLMSYAIPIYYWSKIGWANGKNKKKGNDL